MNEFILTLFKSGHKVRVSTMYQLLIGRRTSSVLLYGFFHENLSKLGSFPKLKKELFYQVIQQLIAQGYLIENEELVGITIEGSKKIERTDSLYDAIDFFSYGRTDKECWRLLKFSIQVVSQMAYRENHYLPTETSPFYTYKIKQWLQGKIKEVLIEEVFTELTSIFAQLPQNQADYLAQQLVGANQVGMLPYQLCPSLSDPTELYLYQSMTIHALLDKITEHSVFYPLIVELFQQNQNQSMLVTKNLILHGQTPQQVMEKRKIKEGTLSDHLIEWAIISDDFPFEKFLSHETIQWMQQFTHEELVDIQYRDISKETTINYREFRLYQIQQVKGGKKNRT
ncbi:MAG: helix-turn-helix domain-containing protein [Enterococcus sp.]